MRGDNKNDFVCIFHKKKKKSGCAILHIIWFSISTTRHSCYSEIAGIIVAFISIYVPEMVILFLASKRWICILVLALVVGSQVAKNRDKPSELYISNRIQFSLNRQSIDLNKASYSTDLFSIWVHSFELKTIVNVKGCVRLVCI